MSRQSNQTTEVLFKLNDDCQMLLEVYDAIIDGTCTLSQAVEIVATVGDYNEGVTQTLPSKKVETTESLFDFLDMSPFDSQNGFDSHTLITPAAKVPDPLLTASYPLKSTVTAVPSTVFDPFANDPAPFGPSTSSIDDLLAPLPTANPKIDDIFGNLSTSSASITEQRKPLRFDPMQAFDAVPPIPFQQYSMTGMGSGAAITSSAVNGDFNPFNITSGIPTQHGFPQQPFPQQIFPQPQQAHGIHPTPVSDSFSPYSFQNQPQPPYQRATYEDQQPSQLQGMPNSGYLPYQQSNQFIYNDGRQAPPMNASGAPPSFPPPAAPQGQREAHNPFDGL